MQKSILPINIGSIVNSMKGRVVMKNTSNKKMLSFVGPKMYAYVPVVGVALVLSWVYAVCSYIAIPLPFNLVPLSLQPFPVLFFAISLGYPAVLGYVFFLVEGMMGLPVFAPHIASVGFARLVGPTGGYLLGFLLAGAFLAAVRTYKKNSLLWFLIKVYSAVALYFACALAQLSFFVPVGTVFAAGLYPFVIGDIVIKPVLLVLSRRAVARLLAYFL